MAPNTPWAMRMAMRIWISTVAATVVCVLTAWADPLDTGAAARMLAPFIDNDTFAIARVDLASADIDSLQRVAAKAGIAANDLAEHRKVFRDIHGQLRSAGAREIYSICSLADLPMPGPFLLVTTGPGGDTAAVVRVLEGVNMESTWVSGNIVAAGPKKSIERLKSLKPSPRPDLPAALGAFPDAAFELVVVLSADQRRVLEEQFPKLPPQIGGGPGTILSRGLKWAAVGIETKPKVAVKFVAQASDAAAAQALGDVAAKAVAFAAEAGKEMQLDLAAIVPVLTPKVAGDRLTLTVHEDDEAIVKLLAGATSRTRSAAGRTRSMNHLKQLALALHNYHDANGSFPATGTLAKDGKPLLSWRVHILPYLEQDNLYKQFKLDEPWDREHNKALIAQMPKVLRSPAQRVGDGKTTYLAPMAKDTVIAPGPKGARLADITDGTSNTIMLVETNDEASVIWTKPDDLDVKTDKVVEKLVGHYNEGFIAGFADGSVRFIRKSIEPAMLKALFTRNGGEVVGKIP